MMFLLRCLGSHPQGSRRHLLKSACYDRMIRLQKLLAAAGLGSRRAIEEWIRAGRVSVGGRIVQLGDRATSADDVRLDGVKLDLDRARAAPPELLLYYKPVGEVTTRSDPQRRPPEYGRPALRVAAHRTLDCRGTAGREHRRAPAADDGWGTRPPPHAPLERSAARVPGARA